MRLAGLDIARFIAFAGMVLVNFRIAAQISDSTDWPNQITNLLEGRAAALFVVLAGIGISLAKPSKALLAKRGLFLFAIGLMNQTIFQADILHYYGIYFLCIIPLLNLSQRGFLIAAISILLISFLMLIGLNYESAGTGTPCNIPVSGPRQVLSETCFTTAGIRFFHGSAS